MRTLFLALTISLLALPAQAQVSGDTVIVKNGGAAKDNPGVFGDKVFKVSEWDTLKVVGQKENYLKVMKKEKEGWVNRRSIFTEAEAREARREKAAARRRAKKRRRKAKELRRQLRRKGYTVVIAAQTFEKNSADGIDIGLGLINISETKTVKYATATWQLYNPVGDPVEKGLDSSTAKTRFVGPLEPEEAGRSTFENVWYSSVGSCAELKKLVVEHIDGSSFTYINDLKDIGQLSESVRLDGDCSYEAQQRREN